MATVGVEVVNRLMRFRAKDLRQMLAEFYYKELSRLTQDTSSVAENEFVEKLIHNPFARNRTLWLEDWFRDRTMLSPIGLITKLPRTDAGKALLALSEDEIDIVLDSILAKYEEYGKAATDLFKRRSQFISLIAGVAVAFMLNVDALYMFDVYLRDSDTRQAVIANAESISRTWESVRDGLSSTPPATGDTATPAVKTGASLPPATATGNASPLVDVPGDPVPPAASPPPGKVGEAPQPNSAGGSPNSDVPGDPPPASAATDSSAANKKNATIPLNDGPKDLAEVKGELKLIKTLIEENVNRNGAPLGYDRFVPPASILWPPSLDESQDIAAGDNQDASQSTSSKGKSTYAGWRNVGGLMLWALRVLVSGLLIGLGGPFWFNIVQSLMFMVGGSPKPAKDEPAATGPATALPPTTEIKAIFKSIKKTEAILPASAVSDT